MQGQGQSVACRHFAANPKEKGSRLHATLYFIGGLGGFEPPSGIITNLLMIL